MIYARLTSITGDAAQIDACVAFLREEVMPTITGADGCMGISMLVDRDAGHCCGTARFATHEALAASREMAQRMREERGAMSSTTFTDIAECELVVAHLRVPELV